MEFQLNKYVLLFAVIVLSFSCSKKEREPFSFIQLCDTQLGMGGYKHDVKTFRQAVKQVNELNPDFVIICGDLVQDANDSSYTDFKSIMEGFHIPCYLAPGNHDVGNVPNDTTLNYYRETIGKDYYDFEHKDHSFIVTNTQFWKVDIHNESNLHDQWFKKTLTVENEKQQPIFVIGHYPLYTVSPTEKEHYFNLPIKKRKELLQLFTENNVEAYLSGHTHKLVVNNYKNIQLVSGETTSKNFDDRPFGFRHWQVSTDTIKHQFVSLEDLSNN